MLDPFRKHRKQKHSLWIFWGTIILLLLIIYTTIKIHNIAFDETKRSHQLLLTEMADAASTGINYYLKDLAEDLQLLASFPRLQYFEKASLSSHVDKFFKPACHQGVEAIFVANLHARIVYSTTESLPQWVDSLLNKQTQWAQRAENYEQSWYSAVLPKDVDNVRSELYFVVLVPLVQYFRDSLPQSPDMKPVGLIGEVVSFNWLVQQYVAPITVGISGAAWVMDGRGRLLYHPKHPEMILRKISENSSDCLPCHYSFDVQSRMVSSEAGSGEYTVGGEPTKIMAHVPINIKDERWVLVVSTYLSEVTAILRDKFRLFFILVVIIIAVIVVSGLLLYYLNAKRIRAEEAHRHIEQKEQLQQQINHAAKLASLGELVDTVAHEINTPISIIAAQIDALLLQKTETSMYEKALLIIKAQTQRINNYTRSLLDYSQRIPFKPEPTDLVKLFDECLYLLGHRFRTHRIAIIKNFTNNLPHLQVDRGQIEQVFINLLNNAADALDGHGEIKIDIRQSQKEQQEGIEICITDNGKGISAESLPHIFKPFFSTKQPSKGTGLGLSISKAIIQRHQGKINVTSTEGQGATFYIFLPLTSRDKL